MTSSLLLKNISEKVREYEILNDFIDNAKYRDFMVWLSAESSKYMWLFCESDGSIKVSRGFETYGKAMDDVHDYMNKEIKKQKKEEKEYA